MNLYILSRIIFCVTKTMWWAIKLLILLRDKKNISPRKYHNNTLKSVKLCLLIQFRATENIHRIISSFQCHEYKKRDALHLRGSLPALK